MTLSDLLLETKNIDIHELQLMIDDSSRPIYVLVAGSIGSGKSFIVSRDLNVEVVDPDAIAVELGNGKYSRLNVAKSIQMVKKAVNERLMKRVSFLQQGTSANLQSTIKKLKKAKDAGFLTALLYVETTLEQAIAQVAERIESGGRGVEIEVEQIIRSHRFSALTFKALTGFDVSDMDLEDAEYLKQVFEKTESDVESIKSILDFYLKIDNKRIGYVRKIN